MSMQSRFLQMSYEDFLDAPVGLEEKQFSLVIADPPYGNITKESFDRISASQRVFTDWMLTWVGNTWPLVREGGSMFIWGGIGKVQFRPLYDFLSKVEYVTSWTIQNHITWSKKRAYGKADNYLFTREELIWLTNGAPKPFHIPLLDQLRGYEGYNAKFPAKSPYKRRTNIWSDVTEIFQGKIHPHQKPLRLYEILVETHTDPGEWVLEPFAGSAPAMKVCEKLGRNCISVDSAPR